MDYLLSPCKMCLHCLPVFSSVSPPSSPRPSSAVAPVPSHATSQNGTNSCASAFATNSSENDIQEGEKPSFSDASLSHDHQHQDLPLSEHAKELGSPVYAPADLPLSEHAKMLGSPVHPSEETKLSVKIAHHDTSHNANQVAFPVPYNDVEFSTPGFDPLLPPITPTPIGLGYNVGQHVAASHHIHHQVSSQHNEGHSFLHSHSHSHDKVPHLHPSSHSTQDEQHVHPPLSSSGDRGEGHAHHLHSHKKNNDAQDDGHHAPPSESSHTNVDHLKTSHSMPDASAAHDKYNSFNKDTAMNWSSNTLETSQSEPIEGASAGRMRRRDQLKHQLEDIRNQLKQGGHHLEEEGSKHIQSMVSNMKEEGSKHLQSMVSNMNKIGESGNLFIAPHS